uniref:RING-type domain-containing protein n=1 Tax=Chlamydomonas leiostraca TaxID=1034604 RepID=A0A7S0S5E5_9CHLO|mmetsp:Transcript_8448/g.21130  ORF Transcript_8448/g.21130 Transcript_8448/m.21130 type:complete len:248 (+) Transcript_8448:73-816(+)
MAEEDIDVCAICRDTCSDIYITSCSHAFCGRCICTVLQRAVTGLHGRASQSCPVCRRAITACSTTAVPDTARPFLKLQLGKVLVTVDVPAGMQPLNRLCKLFDVKPSSVKFIHKGRRIGPEDLADVAAAGGTATILPARAPALTIRQRAQHLLALLLLWARAMWAALIAWPPVRALRAAARRQLPVARALYRSTLGPVVDMVYVVAASVNPSFTPGQAEAMAHQAAAAQQAAAAGAQPPAQQGRGRS